MRKEKSVLPLRWSDDSKAMPGERCNWETTTRSAPLMTNVPAGHERDFAHIYLLLLNALLFLEAEGDVEGSGKGLALALALEALILGRRCRRRRNRGRFSRRSSRWEDFLKQPGGLPPGAWKGDVLLKELDVGIELDLDEVGWLCGFFELPK